MAVSVSAKQLKGIVMCIPRGGTRTPPQDCTVVGFFFLTAPSLSPHPLPSLINISLNLLVGTQGRSWRLNEAYFLPKRNSGHIKTFVPRSPTGSCSVSVEVGTNPELSQRALQLSLACGFMLKSAEARSRSQHVNTFPCRGVEWAWV